MADENTEGSRKRKSTSGSTEPTSENTQASEESPKVPTEDAGNESFEPSAKCQKTSTNLEIHPDTQTTQSAMKLNENEASGIENPSGTDDDDVQMDVASESEVKIRYVDNTQSAQIDEEDVIDTSLNIKNNKSKAQTPLSTNLNNANLSISNTSTSETLTTPETTPDITTNNVNIMETTPIKQLESTPEIPSNKTPNQLETTSETPVNNLESTLEIPSNENSTQLETTPISMHANDGDKTEMYNEENQNDENWDSQENEEKDTCGYPPVITITFSNNDSKTYKPAFLEFIQNFTDLDVVDLNNAIHLFKPECSEVPTKGYNKAPRYGKKKKKAKKELFIVDANPTLDEELEMDKVKFSSKFKALDEEEEEVKVEVSSPALSMCFNCSGNHSIKNCPIPRDFTKIRLARQKFKSNVVKSARYHVEEDQKFAHLKPGRISSKLREALGLGKYELPAHVYKMRVLGYPPGWLEEAKIVRSNICMFDMEGKFVKDKGWNKKKHLDPDRIINYPGFNVEMERGFRDQGHLHGVPKYSQTHTKEAMIKFVNNMCISLEDNLETCDMDIDNSSDKEVSEETTQSRTSPTLTDLEIKKKQLLAELVGNNSSSCETEATPENTKEEINNGDKNSEENNGHIIPINHVKRSVIGTPILKSGSPYARLPKADNFMKDVSPVIYFENLPNSTGKYEKMTGVLAKVRKSLKNIQEKT